MGTRSFALATSVACNSPQRGEHGDEETVALGGRPGPGCLTHLDSVCMAAPPRHVICCILYALHGVPWRHRTQLVAGRQTDHLLERAARRAVPVRGSHR